MLQAVYDEIVSQRPGHAKQADSTQRLKNYRHDENVIRSGPTLYRVVVVPSPGEAEYVTGKQDVNYMELPVLS